MVTSSLFWLCTYLFDPVLSLSPFGFPGESVVKYLPAMQETSVWSLGWEDPLEKGMATLSSIPAWRIPWTEEPGGLQSTGSQRVRHDWATKPTHPLSLLNAQILSLDIFPLLNQLFDLSVPLFFFFTHYSLLSLLYPSCTSFCFVFF